MRTIVGGLIVSLAICLPSSPQEAEKKAVGTNLVALGAPYSPGILAGDALYISGLQGTDPQLGARVEIQAVARR